MEELLYQTIALLEILNKKDPQESITQEEFKEERENIEAFLILKKQLKSWLKRLNNELENPDIESNKDQINECLVYLHIKYSHAAWHFEQIDLLIIKIIDHLNNCFLFARQFINSLLWKSILS